MSVEPLVYSIVDAAKALGVSRSTMYRLIADGGIDARSLGARVVIPVASLRAYVEALPKHHEASES